MTTVLGLDSGGTKTMAALVDRDVRVLRRWSGPGFDPLAGDGWIEALGDAVRELCAGHSIAAAVIGLPVHGEVEAISARQRAVVGSLLDCPHLVLNDVEVACDGAFAGGDGVLLLAGTGSMAWASVGGKSARFGGWGHAFGDEGSGFWIGREALSLASRALDGRIKASGFAAAILAACGVEAGRLIEWGFGQANQRAAFAALARTVSRLANQGDATATALLHSAGQALAEHAVAARSTLGQPALDWSYAGGVFQSQAVADAVAHRLGSPVVPKLPPFGGAVFRAARLAGWPAGAGFIASLAASIDNQP